MQIIYKITYPNGKIYIGTDLIDSINHSGTGNGAVIAKDFSRQQRRRSFMQREIIWNSETATDSDVVRKAAELIRQHSAGDPAIGYNRWPLRRCDKCPDFAPQPDQSLVSAPAGARQRAARDKLSDGVVR